MDYLNVKYLTEVQVAEMTGVALSTLRNQRFNGEGMPYVKLGRSVRYGLSDVITYMESHKIDTTSGNLKNGSN